MLQITYWIISYPTTFSCADFSLRCFKSNSGKVYALYFVFFTGPWFLGELLEGHTGVVFVWGMFVYGSYLPLCLTYVYGAFQASRHGVSWVTLRLTYHFNSFLVSGNFCCLLATKLPLQTVWTQIRTDRMSVLIWI